MWIDMYDIDRLADAHYANRDPQFDDDTFICPCCMTIHDIIDGIEHDGVYYCNECAEDLGYLEEEEDE